MEFKSFVSGVLFLLGVQMLMPVLGIRVDIILPYSPYSAVIAGIVAVLLAYYLFKSN